MAPARAGAGGAGGVEALAGTKKTASNRKIATPLKPHHIREKFRMEHSALCAAIHTVSVSGFLMRTLALQIPGAGAQQGRNAQGRLAERRFRTKPNTVRA
jgi:hypothetical protein